MPVLGAGGTDIVNGLKNIVDSLKNKRAPLIGLVDGYVLKIHYYFSACMWLMVNAMVMGNWFRRDSIVCVSGFSAQGPVRGDYINFCMSYPYIMQDDGSPRYILYYRYMYMVFAIMLLFNYAIYKLVKDFEPQRIAGLMNSLHKWKNNYLNMDLKIIDEIYEYLLDMRNTHTGIYFRHILCHVFALIIDIFSFFFLDFVLQGNFRDYGYAAYPYEKDTVNYKDHMSTVFPPFANCTIYPRHELVSSRIEKFRCQLTENIMYEKFFLFVWFYLIILMAITTIYILLSLTLLNNRVRRFALGVHKPNFAKVAVGDVLDSALKVLDLGDVYLLYRLRPYVSHCNLYELLCRVTLMRKDEKEVEEEFVDTMPPNHYSNTSDTKPLHRAPDSSVYKRTLMPNDIKAASHGPKSMIIY